MYSLFDSYRILNSDLIEVIDSMSLVKVVSDSDSNVYVHRMKEEAIDLGFSRQQLHPIIVAHDLEQYINRFNDIHVVDKIECWMDYLINLSYDE